jgi:hypothetical protein
MKSSFHPLKDTLIIYHTTKMNAILQNKPFKKNYLTTGKAEAACSDPTGRRWDGEKVVLYLLIGTAYDPEGLAAVAGQQERRSRLVWGTSTKNRHVLWRT